MNDTGSPSSQIGSRVTAFQASGPFTLIPKAFYIGQLAGTAGTLYTAPAAFTVANAVGLNPKAMIERIWLCNTDTATRTITLYLVESGGSTADNRAILKDYPMNPKTDRSIDGPFYLEAAGLVRGLADVADKVTVTIHGTEMT